MSNSIPVGVLCLAATLVVGPAPVGVNAEEPGRRAPAAQTDQAQMEQAMPPEVMAAMKKAATPGKQHKWLAGKAGMWEFSGKFWMEPSQPPTESTGTAERTVLLGGRVLAETVKAGFMGQSFEGYGLMGYDNLEEQFWSTWTDTMSTHLMTSTGTCDDQGKCTFTGEYPDIVTGETKTMRAVSRDEGPDKEVHEAFEVGSDGKERKTMELVYTRKSS